MLCEVIDARDPLGTRSYHVEEHLKKNCPNKHLILILNKCDLIPTSITVFFKELNKIKYIPRENGKNTYQKSTLPFAIMPV